MVKSLVKLKDTKEKKRKAMKKTDLLLNKNQYNLEDKKDF